MSKPTIKMDASWCNSKMPQESSLVYFLIPPDGFSVITQIKIWIFCNFESMWLLKQRGVCERETDRQTETDRGSCPMRQHNPDTRIWEGYFKEKRVSYRPVLFLKILNNPKRSRNKLVSVMLNDNISWPNWVGFRNASFV